MRAKNKRKEVGSKEKVALLITALVLLGIVGTAYKTDKIGLDPRTQKIAEKKDTIDCNKKVEQTQKDELASIINGQKSNDACVFMGCSQFFQ